MPSTTVRQYYLQGTGGTNTCTSLGQSISGDLSFEYIVQGNGSGGYIIGFGMSPDSGWGGSESSDLRCFSAGGGVYYDWGSFRRERDTSPNMSAFYGHKMKIEGSKLGVKCTDLETNTVLFNWSVSASGTPSGPLMLCTTSGVRFYEGKVWKNSTLLLDYTVDENGLKENVNNTRPSVSNLTLTYEEVTTEYWPDDTPQQDNVLAGKTPTILLFRRRILSPIPVVRSDYYTGAMNYTGVTVDGSAATVWRWSNNVLINNYPDQSLTSIQTYILDLTTDYPCHPRKVVFWPKNSTEGYQIPSGIRVSLKASTGSSWITIADYQAIHQSTGYYYDGWSNNYIWKPKILNIPDYEGTYDTWQILCQAIGGYNSRFSGYFSFDHSPVWCPIPISTTNKSALVDGNMAIWALNTAGVGSFYSDVPLRGVGLIHQTGREVSLSVGGQVVTTVPDHYYSMPIEADIPANTYYSFTLNSSNAISEVVGFPEFQYFIDNYLT